MNKMIKIVFLFLLSISLLSIGMFCNSKLNKYDEKRPIEDINRSTYIALINLDEGIELDGKKIHYTQNMLNLSDEKFRFTSLNDAKTGIQNGIYAAYIVLPSTFSASIESINEKPLKIDLEYEISDKLATGLKTNIIKDIEDFKCKLSNDISYLYINAVMDEFHNAQDNSKIILNNDKEELERVSSIKAKDMISSIEFPEIKFVEFIRNKLEIEPIVSANLEVVDAMKNSLFEKIQSGKYDYESVSKERGLLGEDSREFLDTLAGLDIESDDNGESVYKAGMDKLEGQVHRYNADINNNREWISSQLASNSNAARNLNQEYVDNNLNNIKNSWQNTVERFLTRGMENLLAMQERIYDELDFYVKRELEIVQEYYKQEAGREIETYKESLISELIEAGLIGDDEGDPIYAIIKSHSNADIRIATCSNAENFNLRNAQVEFIDREGFNSALFAGTDILGAVEPENSYHIPDIAYLLGEVSISLPENTDNFYAGFIEGIERMYTISTTDIEITVQNEIVGAIKSRSNIKHTELRSVMNKLNNTFDDYQNSLEQFDPFSHIDTRILEKSAKSINANVQDIAAKSSEYASEQNEEVSKVREQESEYTKALRENADIANKNTEESLSKTLDAIKDNRQTNSDENKTLLEDFNNKLSYTKVGSIANKEVLEFISAPVQSSEIKSVKPNNFNNFIKNKSPYDKVNMYVMIISAVMTLGMGISLGFMRFRKEKNA